MLAVVLLGGAMVLAVLWWRDQSGGRGGGIATDGPGATVASKPDAAGGAVSAASRPVRAARGAGRVTPEQLRGLLEATDPVQPGEVENAAALELLRWWAELEPVAAIEFAVRRPELHGRKSLAAELFVTWLDARPVEAARWVAGLPAGDLRAQVLPPAISLLAGREPQAALRLAGELSGEQRATALAAVFAEWSALDPVAAVQEARRLPEPSEQNLALRQALGAWMDRDAPAAIAWVKRQPPDPAPDSRDVFPPVIGIGLEKWAAQAPVDAAAYLVSLPEMAGRMEMLGNVAGQWAARDARQALGWAATIAAESDRNVAVRGVLAAVAQTEARAAAELALTLPPGLLRESGLRFVLEPWAAREPAAAATWARGVADPAVQAWVLQRR